MNRKWCIQLLWENRTMSTDKNSFSIWSKKNQQNNNNNKHNDEAKKLSENENVFIASKSIFSKSENFIWNDNKKVCILLRSAATINSVQNEKVAREKIPIAFFRRQIEKEVSRCDRKFDWKLWRSCWLYYFNSKRIEQNASNNKHTKSAECNDNSHRQIHIYFLFLRIEFIILVFIRFSLKFAWIIRWNFGGKIIFPWLW